jgi:hypothetical protein
MMDAIGNTLQGATAVRGSGQQSVPQTAQPEADPLAGAVPEPSRYYSPVVRIDSETQRTVLQFRDGSDGKVLVQYPSEKQLEAYRSRATAERAKEQEQAEARITGEQTGATGTGKASASQSGTSQPGTGQSGTGQTVTGPQAGSQVAGRSTDRGGDTTGQGGGTAAASSAGQRQPIAVATSAPSVQASMPASGGGPAFGAGRSVLQSISA